MAEFSPSWLHRAFCIIEKLEQLDVTLHTQQGEVVQKSKEQKEASWKPETWKQEIHYL